MTCSRADCGYGDGANAAPYRFFLARALGRAKAIVVAPVICVALMGFGLMGISVFPAFADEPGFSLDYHLFQESADGDRVELTYSVVIGNLSDGEVSSLRAILRDTPSYISVVDPELEVGSIQPLGESESVDTFSISIRDDIMMPDFADLQWELVFVDESGTVDEVYVEDRARLSVSGN